MCGIAGKVDFRGELVDRALIERMCGTIAHRGPDDERVYVAPGVGLGQRRLAIIDLDPRAAAPLSNEDGTIWVTFIGEIYNFRELRTELERKGHTFCTHTDTEVIVHAYEEYGIDCLSRFRGMFAFALWDAPRKRLFAARDRLGKKPFVYAKTSTGLVFGSEIKAVTADPSISIAPDLRAIDFYLTYQYVPSPMTAFEGICKLPPAHYLIAESGNVRVERYWSAEARPASTLDTRELERQIVERLREAVRMRLVSDVPLGAFLSGGIDSATVVALMAEASEGPVKTFSIGFEDAGFDELPYARLVAQRYGTDHHEVVVRPNAAELLPKLVHHYNEPFANYSALPTYCVSQITREHVTVALSGDGGDENFAGYENYATVMAWGRGDVIPGPVRRTTAHAAQAMLDALPHTATLARASRAFTMFAGDVPKRFMLQLSIFKPQEKAAAYTAAFRSAVQGQRSPVALEWNGGMDALEWMMRHDQSFYLPDSLNVKVDIAAMANSLEVRCPLLDHEFIEFTATIPSALKRNAHGGKQIFKRAVASLLPEEILTRKKTGFGFPVAAWFRNELQPLLRANLLDDRARSRGLFEPSFIRRMVDDHVAGARDWSTRLFALLFLELWFREFID
jgi:asparagine synthase (glutamine-hydrolysing)